MTRPLSVSHADSADELVDGHQEVEHGRQKEDAADADPQTPRCPLPTARRRRWNQTIGGPHHHARGQQTAPRPALPPPHPYEDDGGHGREGRQLEMLDRRISTGKRHGHIRHCTPHSNDHATWSGSPHNDPATSNELGPARRRPSPRDASGSGPGSPGAGPRPRDSERPAWEGPRLRPRGRRPPARRARASPSTAGTQPSPR